ncbi:MAG: hypothetical protein LBJ97_00655 [Mycoplasmataceae bacterium]|nr:hypothetical protein [Mycoplasmataceae bacterium]
MLQHTGWNGDTQSIIFLVVACICLVLSGLSIYWLTYCIRNKIDPNVAQTKNWFFKWMHKNRLVWSFMITIVVVLCTIVFFLYAFGIELPFTPVD